MTLTQEQIERLEQMVKRQTNVPWKFDHVTITDSFCVIYSFKLDIGTTIALIGQSNAENAASIYGIEMQGSTHNVNSLINTIYEMYK